MGAAVGEASREDRIAGSIRVDLAFEVGSNQTADTYARQVSAQS